MALALYRKYRPRTFAEVIGQEHVTEPLIQALSSGRLNHAYLFSGPRGCGKTSSARILARSLNCEKGPTPDPCGECESCRALAPDGPGSIDVIEIDAASHGGVDDARELRERAFFAPAVSRFKIYIIDEAHMVSSAGFNALLKLVEEPPDYVKFVFATTEPEKVLGTIKSRTHHYPFRLMPPGVLRPYLEKLCDLEGVTVDPLVLPLVVRAGGGSARDSLSVLDQLIAGAGPEGVTYARAVALLGVTDATLIDDVCDALAAGDAAAAFGAIDRVAEAGHDPRRFTADLLERLRDLILLRQVPDAAAKGLIDAPADQVERMQTQAQRLGPATLSRWAEIAHNGLVEMRGTTSTRLLLELITARMLLPTADASEVGLLSRLERLEQGGPVAGSGSAASAGPVSVASDGDGRAAARAAAASAARPAAPAQASSAQAAPTQAGPTQAASAASAAPMSSAPATVTEPEPARPASAPPANRPVSAPASPTAGVSESAPIDRPVSAPATPGAAPVSAPASPTAGVSESAPASGEIDAPALRRAWDEIVQLTGRSNKRTAAMARDGVVRDVDGNTIVLVFKASFHANSVSADPGALLDAVHEVVGGRWQLRCEVGGDPRGGGGGGGGSVARTASRPAQPSRPAAAPREPRSAPPATDDAEDWPATAPIGGTSGGGNGGDVPVNVAGPSAAASVRSQPLAQAPAAQTVSAGGRAATATAVVDEDFGPLDEPPYDPEFDGPVNRSAASGGATATAVAPQRAGAAGARAA
ncbi:MAG: DNA polymerase III subunit gamma and tau, partial [Hamadaea sp.]|uniref:DNA polymerase III subunit gamma and tau n=1 Tax=Hamadaea sp. TaxID=2024425 RepID=UPI001835387C